MVKAFLNLLIIAITLSPFGGDKLFAQLRPFSYYVSSSVAPLYNIVCDGNSLTLGSGATSYSCIIDDSLNADYKITNTGAPGQTIESMGLRYTSAIAPLYKSGSLKNILFYWEGTNIALTGNDTAAIMAFYKDYYDKAKATGWYVVLLTTLPQYYAASDAAVETKRSDINNALRFNQKAYCDALIDIARDTIIGDKGDENDVTHYWDKVHITSAVQTSISAHVLTSIRGVINGYHPETWDWAQRVLAGNGGYSSQMLRAQDTLVILTRQIRHKVQRWNTFTGDSLDAALVPLFNTPGFGATVYGYAVDVNVNFIQADYSPGGGLGSNPNTNKYINTGYNTLNAPLISVYNYSQSFYQLGAGNESGLAMGCYAGSSYRNYLWTNYSSGLTYLAVMGAGESNKAHGSVSEGVWFDNRLNNTCQKYFDAVDFNMGNINASPTKPNLNIYVFCFNSSGSPSTYFTHKSNGYHIGQNHTPAEVLIHNTGWEAHSFIMQRYSD